MGSLNKIIIHYTGGTYKANEHERKCYHFIVQGNGSVILGMYPPEANLNCKDGNYAAHCGGGNTGAIGVALSGMYNGEYPIKRQQLESACRYIAKLSSKYGIRITNKNILTHAEFGLSHPKTTSAGKQDFTSLPCVAVYGIKECGDWFRDKVNWYKTNYYTV